MCSYLLLPSRLPLWRRKWQPTPVFLPGKSQGQKNLDSYSPWYHKSQTQFKPSPPENYLKHICSFCCCSAAQSCLTLYDPVDCSTPGLPVHHHLPELAQTQVHWVCDAIQPSHPLSSPSLPAFNLPQQQGLSQHQGLFQCVGSSHQVAKVLELPLQHQSFQRILRVDLL